MEKYFEDWNGMKFPVRVVPFNEDYGCGSPINVSSYELWKSIEDAYNNGDRMAEEIDNEIFCYVDPEFFAKEPTDDAIRNYVIDFIL